MDTTQHYSGLVYHPHVPQPQHIVDSVPPQSYPQEMAWQVPQHSPSNPSASSHVQMQSMMPHSQDHVEYAPPSAQQSFLSRHAQDFSNHHPPSPSMDPNTSGGQMSFDSPQIPGSIGPDRGLSRRRLRPPSRVQSHGDLSEYAAMPEANDPVQHSHYPSQQGSRPQTPTASGVPEQFIQPQEQPRHPYPSPSGFYRYPYNVVYHQPGNRSTSGSTSSSAASATSNPRSASPALSTTSALTSVSATSAPYVMEQKLPLQPFPERKENKKRRLYNTDRRDICMFARDHPGVKQEDIASHFGVERSTVSKILKQRHRWLHVQADEEVQVAKMRPSKFPELEYRLAEWVKTVSKNGTVLSDALLRQRAREIGDSQGYTPDKFKASSGWLENFKHRHGIRRGVWTGSGQLEARARANAEDFPPPVLEDCPPGPFLRMPTPSEGGPSQSDYGMGVDDGDGQTQSTGYDAQDMHPSTSLNGPSTWSRTDESASSSHASDSSLMYPPGGQSSYSLSHDAANENERSATEASAMPAAEPVAISLGQEDGGEGEQVYVVPVMPEVLESEAVPGVAEAEKALDKVLSYVRANHAELELGDPGFSLLVQLKYKLFGKATGQPLDPRYVPKIVPT